ncbi:ParB/RepB/Spo0J family partition protein [Conchiformibius kuhniae]|uniref:ParB/RepB/Spo0J family partition protein n=1 Tax=Conchiformibius kuhniae TaxID=211502 RepID=A0A8T9MZ29_9NEIS|nr:ParB/RepB/Spo0J family partition protein [Conchiformibius kuhniae]UOP05063.1 ParB/RepB/Spo0J family partition protein [Conchiformibius kuhniae]
MAAKPKGLGRGLDSLISFTSLDDDSGDRLSTVPIGRVRPGRYQPRVQMDNDALQELAESIRAQGVIQPVVVRELGGREYELIAGERRWRAAQMAGLDEIPVVIKNTDDKTAMAMGLIENIQRENLNPIEEAQGFKRLIDEFELTHETVAEVVGRSRSAISNSLRLLKLPEPVQEMLFDRQLEMGHARAIVNLSVEEQLDLANKAVRHGWSVREMERRSRQVETYVPPPPRRLDPDVGRLADSLTEHLGVPAQIQTRDRKKGKIVLHFDSADAFDGLMARLGVAYEEDA